MHAARQLYRRHPRTPNNTGNLITAGLENDFSNAYWTKAAVTVASEAHPQLGTIWKITEAVDGAPARHAVERGSNLHTDDLFYRKILVKAGNWPFLTLMGRSGAFGSNGVGFNMLSGQLYYPGTVPLFAREFYGDGWWDASLIMAVDEGSGVSNRFAFGLGNGNSSATQTYQGDGTRYFYACYARAILP